MTISGLLEPNRAARTISFNARDRANPHFSEVVAALVKATWGVSVPLDAKHAAVQRAVQSLTVARLMDLAASDRAQPQVRAVASEALRLLLATVKRPVVNREIAAHHRATADDIERFLARPAEPRKQSTPLQTPPGDPIGN